MYPGGQGNSHLNHKLGYCSDGVKQKFANDEAPPWPQPHGIFSRGTDFNLVPFFVALREIYERLVTQGEVAESISVEHEAFARMLNSCTSVQEDSAVLFRLYDLNMPHSVSAMVVTENGTRFLRLDCLSDGQDFSHIFSCPFSCILPLSELQKWFQKSSILFRS
jgi:hypothetical protein